MHLDFLVISGVQLAAHGQVACRRTNPSIFRDCRQQACRPVSSPAILPMHRDREMRHYQMFQSIARRCQKLGNSSGFGAPPQAQTSVKLTGGRP